MGVAGLWSELKPVALRQSFEKTALEVFDDAYRAYEEDGVAYNGRLLGLKVGIDASAWFIHSDKSEGGANPALRNMFHRVIRLARAGVHALFVFDGPHRPRVKRGRPIWRGRHELQVDFERIVEAFGFEWRTAPGEAEAELAYLNSRKMLDLVITDDVDCLLFGASTLMKHALINQPTESIHPQLYERGTIELELELTVPGLVLVAMMSGGDYDQGGLTGIGPKISLSLAKAGFGERLQAIMTTSSGAAQAAQLQDLRNTIRHELRTNESGYFDRKAGAVAGKFHDSWPDVGVASSYYNAITTRLHRYRSFDKEHTWDKAIDVPELVKIMDESFEYIHAEILQKLRSQIWQCMIVQSLVRKIHQSSPSSPAGAPAPSPSKVLASALEQATLDSPPKKTCSTETTALNGLGLLRIDKKRAAPKKAENHITDEVQLLVCPRSAIALAKKHLQHPDPNIGKLEARKITEAAVIARTLGPNAPGAVPAPPRNSHYDTPEEECKLWIQESLLIMAVPELVDDWEQREAAKLAAKLNKGKKGTAGKTSPAKGGRRPSANSTPPKSKSAKAKSNSSSEPARSQSTAMLLPSEDVFGSPEPIASTSGTQSTSRASSASTSITASARSIKLPSIPQGRYKRSNGSEERSSSGSDSDVVLVLNSETVPRKSPKKSPRKSASQATARANVAGHPGKLSKAYSAPPADYARQQSAVQLDLNPGPAMTQADKDRWKIKLPKKVYDYHDLSDESEDEDLPSLMQIARKGIKTAVTKPTTKAAQARPMAQSTSLTSLSPSSGEEHAKTRPTSQRSKANADVSIIDLCSSD